MRLDLTSIVLLIALGLAACGPGPAPTTGGAPRGDSGTAGDPSSRTLGIIMRVEPPTMMDSAVDRSAVHKPLFSAGLGYWNLQNEPYPVLAEKLPTLNTDTWKVTPDGKMETTYRLRRDLTWHDGTPLTAEDFAFGWRVEVARVDWGLDQTSAELRQTDEVVAPDTQTVVIRWKRPYMLAAAPDLLPFPRAMLQASLDQGDGDAFGNLAYWTTDYVGAGPFRVEHWERGAFIEGVAFDKFALGKPKIGRVRLTWNNDPNVTVTRLMAGDADVALDGSLRFDQARTLKEQWVPQTNGTLLLNPTSLRYIQVQARPDYVNPKALLDVRVRRAVLQSIDRSALAETMLDDSSMVADTIPPPSEPYFPDVSKAITKYPYDLRAAEQNMAQAGFTKGPDGVYVSPTDGRMHLEVRGVSGGQEEQDTTIVAGNLHDGGFDPAIMLLPSSTRAVDDKTKGTFPALTLNNNTLQIGLGLNKWLTTNIGGPDDNWVGGNRMGWSDPEFDRIYDQWTTTLDRAESNRLMVQMMKRLSDELPSLPLYYNFQIVAYSGAITGPEPITPDSTRFGNIHEWAWK
ncbi:MAG TPA: ABC transporter substrate-binding protein [Chloroflexota bacterium]|nr:ABC transporter substrate-binding protein [Chloroflexota bacterium]